MIRQRRPRQRRRKLDPFTRESRSPLEILAMLAGRTNFTTPVEGKSTKEPGLTALDVAHAISTSEEKLGAAVGLAVACQRPGEWPTVHALGYPRLLSEFQRQRDMPGVVAGAKQFRVHIVLRDAFHDLIHPLQRQSYRAAAKENGVDPAAYRFMHQLATAKLYDEYAAVAAGDACRFLFAPMAKDYSGPSLVLVDGAGAVNVMRARTVQALADVLAMSSAPMPKLDALWLLEEMLTPGARQRTLGMLTFAGRRHVAVYVEN